MNRKSNLLTFCGLLAIAMVFSVFASLRAQAADDPGLAVFKDKKHKCGSCHAISSLGFKVESEEKSDDGDAPDLSGEGLHKDHNADWLKKWLKKSVALEGKKHPKKFGGDDKDLDALVNWLVTLKTEVPQKKK